MDLAPDTLRGLELLREPKKVPDAAYTKLLEFALDVVLSKKTEADLAGVPELALDPLVMKQSYSTVVALFLFFAKLDYHPPQQKEFFTSHSFPESRAEAFLSVYGRHGPLLRALLATSGFHFPHIVDVHWRVDYQIRSDVVERINSPIFYVTLKTISEGKEKDVAFSANLDEMQELVAKLKDAAGALDRVDIF